MIKAIKEFFSGREGRDDDVIQKKLVMPGPPPVRKKDISPPVDKFIAMIVYMGAGSIAVLFGAIFLGVLGWWGYDIVEGITL